MKRMAIVTALLVCVFSVGFWSGSRWTAQRGGAEIQPSLDSLNTRALAERKVPLLSNDDDLFGGSQNLGLKLKEENERIRRAVPPDLQR